VTIPVVEFVRFSEPGRQVDLHPMEFGVCTMPDGSRFIIAESNTMGGVCDDCQQWHPEDAESIVVYRIQAPAVRP
jgi:hypothetical protein